MMGKTHKYFPIGSTVVVKVSFWFNELDKEWVMSEEFNFQAVKTKRVFSTKEGDRLHQSFLSYDAEDAEEYYNEHTELVKGIIY